MKISRDNYELFFIDYFDGTLNDREIADLEDFLLINPDLREELEGMERVNIVPEDLILTDKDILKKIDITSPITEETFDDYCVAYFEGDLRDEKISDFESFITAHPEKEKDLNLFKKTFLSPDPAILYHSKNQLKKKTIAPYKVYIFPAMGAAAAIALLMVIFLNPPSPGNMEGPIATIPVEKAENPETFVNTEPGLTLKNTPDGLKPEILAAAEVPVKKITRKSVPAESAEEKTLSELHIIEEIKPSGTIFAQLQLPPVDFGGARPDVIKAISNEREDQSPVNSVREPDYLSLPEIALKYMNSKVLKREEPVFTEPSRASLYEIADASIKGINRLTGSEIKLEKLENDDGKTTAINFDAGFFGFSRPVR